MQYYNLLNKRITKKGEEMWALTDEDKKARLAKKADALQVIGNNFLDLYVELVQTPNRPRTMLYSHDHHHT
jgi:hypothetical protein